MIPEKEVVATDMKASLIFPWQVERILSIKFPEETSRAEQAGYVSSIVCMQYGNCLCTFTQLALPPQGYVVTLAEVAKVDFRNE